MEVWKELIAFISEPGEDDLSVSQFATEVVAKLKEKEDLEGDGELIHAKLMEQIQIAIENVGADNSNKGGLQAGNPYLIQMAVRDPEDGQHTFFLQGEIGIDESGKIFLANLKKFETQLVGDEIYLDRDREALDDFAQQIMYNWDNQYGADANDSFVAGFTDYTTTVNIKPM